MLSMDFKKSIFYWVIHWTLKAGRRDLFLGSLAPLINSFIPLLIANIDYFYVLSCILSLLIVFNYCNSLNNLGRMDLRQKETELYSLGIYIASWCLSCSSNPACYLLLSNCISIQHWRQFLSVRTRQGCLDLVNNRIQQPVESHWKFLGGRMTFFTEYLGCFVRLEYDMLA